MKISFGQTIAGIIGELVYKKRRIGNLVPILCYHRVLPKFVEDFNDPIYTILPEQFESQMAYLAKERFYALSFREFFEISQGVNPIRERSVLITFDDGYVDNYAIAWPIAQKYQMVINLFICTGFIGRSSPLLLTKDGSFFWEDSVLPTKISPSIQDHIQRFPHLWRPLMWDELYHMKNAGVGIALHSHMHRRFASLEANEIIADISTGVDIFGRELGTHPSFFAFPYGRYEDFSPQALEILMRLGFEAVFTTFIGRARLPSIKPLFPRLVIYQQDNLVTFQRKLFGAFDWVEPIRRLAYLAGI